MWTLRRPDAAVLKNNTPGPSRYWCRARLLLIVLLLTLIPSLQAQVGSAQRAIEALESCSKKERKSGCIKILKQRSAGENKQAVKAQVRGGRIIWYEYDKKTGSVRRTN